MLIYLNPFLFIIRTTAYNNVIGLEANKKHSFSLKSYYFVIVTHESELICYYYFAYKMINELRVH